PDETRTELESLMSTLGRLWLAGAPIDWVRFSASERRRRVPLPTYPFERRSFWITPTQTASLAPPGPSATPTSAPNLGPVAANGDTGPSAFSEEPRTPTEAAVLSVWKAVLGDVPIGVSDNFYQVGGHSLMIPNV